MRQARELLLSSCYNYTQNFRKGTAQARRHHAHVEGLNAQISLSLPPCTGAQKFVVDLHWSTANVNLIVDMANQDGDAVTILISKDAKAVIPTDMSPVQRYSRSWSKRMVLPDYTYNQSRVNCITPITFLFLETKVTRKTVNASVLTDLTMPLSEETTLHITRSGQVVTLLNLSFLNQRPHFSV